MYRNVGLSEHDAVCLGTRRLCPRQG